MMRQLNAIVIGLAGLAFVATCSAGQAPDTASGIYQPKMQPQPPPLRVEVIDGTRFRDIESKTTYKLYGVDACAPDQSAQLGRQPWPCGVMATAWLVTATLDRWLACENIRADRSDELVRCATAGHADLAADMLHDGVAVLSPPGPSDPEIPAYVKAQDDARKAYRGLWSSTFEMPWDWRARHGQHSETAMHDEANP